MNIIDLSDSDDEKNQEIINQPRRRYLDQEFILIMNISQIPINLVINTLKDVDPERKCFRMIGGVLVERQVMDVLPALKTNEEQVSKLSVALQKQFEEKGKELVAYKAKHNIRFVGEKDDAKEKETAAAPSSSGVLVS